jgi:hypothetical protein
MAGPVEVRTGLDRDLDAAGGLLIGAFLILMCLTIVLAPVVLVWGLIKGIGKSGTPGRQGRIVVVGGIFLVLLSVIGLGITTSGAMGNGYVDYSLLSTWGFVGLGGWGIGLTAGVGCMIVGSLRVTRERRSPAIEPVKQGFHPAGCQCLRCYAPVI